MPRREVSLDSSEFDIDVVFYHFDREGLQGNRAWHAGWLAVSYVECSEMPRTLDDIAGQDAFL